MTALRLFEAPMKSYGTIGRMYPPLRKILDKYCKIVEYWKLYTVNNTNVFLIKNPVETILLFGNKKRTISEKEIDFAKEKLFDKNKEISEIEIDKGLIEELREDKEQGYKDVRLFRQLAIDI